MGMLHVAHGGRCNGISCEHAAANGHIGCLRIAHQLGGASGISCEHAAKRQPCKNTRVANELGSAMNFM